jgi:hypothetical protein
MTIKLQINVAPESGQQRQPQSHSLVHLVQCKIRGCLCKLEPFQSFVQKAQRATM